MARTVDPEKHAARRAAILGAAATVFAEKGYDAATTADVHRAAGVGSGTLFHYFPDKDTLFRALFEADRPLLEAVVGEVEALPPVEALWRLVDHLVADVDDPLAPGLMVAALSRALRDEGFAEILVDADELAMRCLAGIIRRGQADGVVRADLEPARASRWVHAQVDALYFMCGDEDFDAEAERRELRDVVTRYLGLSSWGRTT